MQLFILNRTNERQTKSVGRILLYALLFFIVTRIAVMLMLTGCTAIYMANTGINPMQGLSFFGNPSVAAAGMGWWAFIIRKSKCSTDFKRNDFLKKTKRTHWVRFVHLNSLIESCVFLYLWNSPFDTFL